MRLWRGVARHCSIILQCLARGHLCGGGGGGGVTLRSDVEKTGKVKSKLVVWLEFEGACCRPFGTPEINQSYDF
jgi:hypothetical protein